MAVEIRSATEADGVALRRLAERDSAPLPTGELTVAIAGGELCAARSERGVVVADPFRSTAAIVAALEAFASAGPATRRKGRGVAVRPRPRLAASPR